MLVCCNVNVSTICGATALATHIVYMFHFNRNLQGLARAWRVQCHAVLFRVLFRVPSVEHFQKFLECCGKLRTDRVQLICLNNPTIPVVV